MNPKNILIELNRRNVYRAAVAYGVVAWFFDFIIIRVLFPNEGAPPDEVCFFIFI